MICRVVVITFLNNLLYKLLGIESDVTGSHVN